jgi:hypothetical protein
MTIEHARARRDAKALVLAELGNSQRTLRGVLQRPPKALQNVDLYDVLMRCPRMGRSHTRAVCEGARVWPHLRMGELTQPQRTALLECLPDHVL